MGIRTWFERRENSHTDNDDILAVLMRASNNDTITRRDALMIPSFAACVEFISNAVAGLTIRLYREDTDGKIHEIRDDPRLHILNDDTGDILTGPQWKKALVRDYLIDGNGYAYKNMRRNTLKSLHYVPCESVSVQCGTDPIYKKCDIYVNGTPYRDFEFIKITRNTKNGVTGTGILQENAKMLSLAFNLLRYENVLMRSGGKKRGFLKSKTKLTTEQLTDLRRKFEVLYADSDNNDVIVLNDGVDFNESSSTSAELQLNESKRSNAAEICKLFCMPPGVIDGTATQDAHVNAVKEAVMPVITALESALNKDLLLESEKNTLYFACDVKDLMKGDIATRYAAYSSAIQAGWMHRNEVRYIEDLEPIDGLNLITLSLGDVLYDIDTKRFYTPNMDAVINLERESVETEGGHDVASGNSVR